MKKLMIGAMLAFSFMCAGSAANAQVRISATFGAPVAKATWYNSDESYYYLPEQGIYYNPTRRVYVFQDNGNWVYSSRLPRRYNGYTWRRSHYVRVRERAPFMHHDEYANHFNQNYRGKHVEWRRGDNDHHDNGRGNHYGHH